MDCTMKGSGEGQREKRSKKGGQESRDQESEYRQSIFKMAGYTGMRD